MINLNKKGAELTLNVIIVAIIVLIVLVVVVIIFSSKFSVFGKTSSDCATQGGYCNANPVSGGVLGDQCPAGETKIGNAKCSGNSICCLKVTV